MDGESLSDFFGESDNFSSADDIFSILEAFESASDYNNPVTRLKESVAGGFAASNDDGEEEFEFQKSAYCYSPLSSPLIAKFQESENEVEPKSKKQKLNAGAASASLGEEGQQRISHITVERQRRKQMNEHLTVLRSLMPCFYVKRGDQASIIGGVVDYINELQQVLQSLEAKKQRKTYTDVLSPRIISSPRRSPLASPLSPRKPPLSPRLSLPISPRTPQPSSPYIAMLHQQPPPSPCNSSTSSINDSVNELVATSKSAVAEVEVKFSGPNLLMKTVSHRIPGQAAKIISALEELALEILQVNINIVDETMLNSFTIKIGIECQLSAEELAQKIQQTFV